MPNQHDAWKKTTGKVIPHFDTHLPVECFVWHVLDYVIIIYSSETNIDLESHLLFEKKGHLNQASIVRFNGFVLWGVLCCSIRGMSDQNNLQ